MCTKKSVQNEILKWKMCKDFVWVVWMIAEYKFRWILCYAIVKRSKSGERFRDIKNSYDSHDQDNPYPNSTSTSMDMDILIILNKKKTTKNHSEYFCTHSEYALKVLLLVFSFHSFLCWWCGFFFLFCSINLRNARSL